MSGTHRRSSNRQKNEVEVARSDFARALSRVVEAKLGPDATFAQREAAAMAAVEEAIRELSEEARQNMKHIQEETHGQRASRTGQPQGKRGRGCQD